MCRDSVYVCIKRGREEATGTTKDVYVNGK